MAAFEVTTEAQGDFMRLTMEPVFCFFSASCNIERVVLIAGTEQFVKWRGGLMRIQVWLTLTIISFLTIVAVAAYGQKQAPMKTLWEYKLVTGADETKLNELGAHGWELVSVQAGRVRITDERLTAVPLEPSVIHGGPLEVVSIDGTNQTKCETTVLYLKRRL